MACQWFAQVRRACLRSILTLRPVRPASQVRAQGRSDEASEPDPAGGRSAPRQRSAAGPWAAAWQFRAAPL